MSVSNTNLDTINQEIDQIQNYNKKLGKCKLTSIVATIALVVTGILFAIGIHCGGHHLYGAMEMVGFWGMIGGGITSVTSFCFKKYYTKKKEGIEKEVTSERILKQVTTCIQEMKAESNMEKKQAMLMGLKNFAFKVTKEQLKTLNNSLTKENIEIPEVLLRRKID